MGNRADSTPVLAIDIGGTKLAAGVMAAGNRIVARHETPTLAAEGAEAVLERVVSVAQAAAAAYGQLQPNGPPPAAVGVASGGQIDPQTGSVVFATENLPGWRGLALGQRLAERLELPVQVENDVNCFAVAEAALGAGRDCRHLLLVVVGTGVGGGIITDGALFSGQLGRAGEVGHICMVPTDGRPCTCGLSGCLESYAATRIMVAQSGFETIQALAAHFVTGAEVSAVSEAAAWLGYGLASMAHVLGPQAMVIGGSIGLLGPRYLQMVHRAFVSRAMVSYRDIPLLAASLGADGGLLGAGLLARRLVTG